MSEVSTIGLDIAKQVFQAHGADAAGHVLFRKKLTRPGEGVTFPQLRPHGGEPGPGQLVLRQPAARVVNVHLVRQVPPPAPQHQVDVRRSRSGHEAGNQHPAPAARLQVIGDAPRRRFLASELEAEPAASEVGKGHALRASGRIVPQVDDVLTVDLVLAHGEWLQPMGETLRALAERRHHVERQIQRRLTPAVKPASGQRSACAGQGSEGPTRIVSAVTAPRKPQANPPNAKWSRYSRTACARPALTRASEVRPSSAGIGCERYHAMA